MPMSSGGHVASSSGCATTPKAREIGSTGYAVPIQPSSSIGRDVMATAEHQEPCDSRGSCTVLGAPGGETPPGDSSSPLYPRKRTNSRCLVRAASCRLWCKSLFPLGIKNSPGCRRDFHVKMWGTSSPYDKLTGDLGNAFEAAEIGGRWSDRLLAGKLSSGDFGLLQQYRPTAEVSG